MPLTTGYFLYCENRMTTLKEKGLLIDSTKVNLLGNTVVLITKNGSTAGIKSFKDLGNSNIKKIALGEPKTEYPYQLCNNIIIIAGGSIDAIGQKDDIFNNPPTLYCAKLTGCKNISKARKVEPNII